jgi:hypothetical protein
MVKVGMYKQQKYEEGVQKIQGQIDKVAGLDIVRDVDKQYLQAKLNELGSKLKTVAAGDFSNFQLVNSVGGMAKQIGKDANVQNAVSSTAWYRKQSADMEKAITDGKSSTENQWDFTDKVNSYLESTDLKQSFRGRYTQYTDVKKKAMEAIKALHPNLQQYDIPYEVKSDGTINTQLIADAMKRYKVEGIDELQIKQAITASLDQNDLNQISISGRYQFRGATPEALVKSAEKSYEIQKKQALANVAHLNEQRGITRDPTKLADIDRKLKQYQDLLGTNGVTGFLDEELRSNVKLAMENPDQVKASMYKNGLISEFANGFHWKNITETYETSPLRAQLNWVKDFDFKEAIENRRRWEFGQTMIREDEKIRLSAEKNALDKVALYGDPAANDWTPVGNATDNELRATELFSKHVGSVASGIEGDIKTLQTKYTDAQINEMIDDWETNTTKATKIKPDALRTIQNISKNKNYLASLEKTSSRLKAEADKKVGLDKVKAQVLAGKAPINLTFRGETFNLSPEEVLGLESATTRIEHPNRFKGTVIEKVVDRSKLNSNQLKFVNALDGIKYGMLSPQLAQSNDITKLDLVLGEISSSYGNAVKKYKNVVNQSNEEYRKLLAPIAQEFVGQLKAVSTSKDGSPPPLVLSRLSQLITAADINQIAADDNTNIETSSEMLLEKNKSDTRVFVYQDGDNFQVHLKSESDPKKRQVYKLSKADIVRYFGEGYVNNNVQESIRVNIGKGNTNLTGDAKDAILQKKFGNFPGITKFQVTADLNQDLSDGNLYIPMINVRRKDGGYSTFQISGKDDLQRVGFDQGRQKLDGLTDATLLKLLQENYPNYDYSNLDY